MAKPKGSSYEFVQILTDEEEKKRFCTWFWSGSNGNNLIDALNSNNSESSGSKIRRRKEYWPHIYCIVLNDNDNPGKSKNGVQWKYCKVGMTEVDTTTETGNRMETVKSEISKITDKSAGIIFVLAAKAIDSRPNTKIEEGVRKHVGWPVDKKFVRDELNLPVPTEWIITTQDYIKKIKDKIEQMKTAKEVIDTGLLGSNKLSWKNEKKPQLPNDLEKKEIVDAEKKEIVVCRKETK